MSIPSKREIDLDNSVPYPGASPALYRVHFFGPFRVMRDNQPLGEPVWRRNKAKALLKWFLLNAGRLVSADQLIGYFWPDLPRPSAERNLHVAIHYLRHVLEPDLLPRQPSSYIRRNKNNYYWFEWNENWWADILQVHQHHTAGKEAEQRRDHPLAIAHYRHIVDYCRLGFLHEDAYEDTFSPYRRHYERLYTQTLESLIHLCSQASLVDEVLTYAHQALLVDPYCEPAVTAIAHAYFHQGNTAGAIRKLDDFQAFLRQDLGVEPGADILSLRKKMSGSR